MTAGRPRCSRKPGYDGKGCRRLRPKEQWIPIVVPPLIGQGLWERAQAQLARNAVLSFRNNKKHDCLLPTPDPPPAGRGPRCAVS